MSRRDVVLAFTIGVLAFAAVFATTGCDSIQGLFGPPKVDLGERYDKDGVDFDHSKFDALLRRHVDAQGFVDYAALASEAGPLDDYIDALAKTDFDALSRDAKLALLINAYNAWTLRLILDHWPLKSIKDIPDAERWNAARWSVAGETMSLDSLEHEWLRKRFSEPRMHFAINCASVGCPPLRAEAYSATKLESQLTAQCAVVHRDGSRWFAFSDEGARVGLTRIYLWFGGDFEQVAGSVLAFAARHNERLAGLIRDGNPPRIDWLEYDWGINTPR